MKKFSLILSALFTFSAGAATPSEPPVVLPKFEVIAYVDDPNVAFFTVRWRTRKHLPSSKIKRAWFIRIQPGGPADKAGVKVGDELLMLGGVDVTTMSGAEMKMSSFRPREYGTREEIVYRNAKGEVRTVEFVYERIKKKPNQSLEPTPMAVTPPAAQEPRQP